MVPSGQPLRRTTMKLSSYSIGLLLVFGATVLLSTAGVMTRMVSMDSSTILFWRGIAGGCVLLAYLFIVSPRRAARDFSNLGTPGWAIVALTAVSMSFFIFALNRTSVAHVAIIFATAPLVSAALGFFFLRERPGRAALAASVVALAGVVLMVGGSAAGGLVGDLLALAMTLCIVANTVVARRYPGTPMMMSAALAALLGTLTAAPFASPLSSSPTDIVIVSVFGIFGLAIGLVMMLEGARLLPPVETALIGALDAPLAPLWVWLIFGEHVDRMTLVGGAIVMAAVTLHVLADIRRRRVAPMMVCPPSAA